MEALLREAGDGLARGDSGDGLQCRSAGELKTKIAQLFGGKVSETRAERVSASFEIPADIVLNMSAVSLDATSSMGDADIHAVQTPSALRTFFTVREVVVNQPDADKDPLAQKAVAAFLIIHVRQADGSVWGVQSTSRATQGWTVSYVCQHSMACWNQENTRRKKHVVGMSITEDMVHMTSLARPAFDCRGVVNITFSRFSRSVVVKYEHTNFHRSVSDLVTLFPPPRPPSPLPLPATVPGSANKRTKDAVDGSGTAPKRKRPRKSAAVQDGGEAAEPAAAEATGAQAPDATPGGKPTKPKKPRKPYARKSMKGTAAGTAEGTSTQDPANIATAAVGAMMDLGIDASPGGDANDNEVEEALLRHLHEHVEDNTSTAADIMDTLVHDESESGADWQLSRESAAAAAAAAAPLTPPKPVAAAVEETSSNGQAAIATAPQQTETTASAAAQQPRPYMLVTEAEVSNERKATAIKLLSDRGVEPGTLTHEQFCTFSNQAPVLQVESLELLAHYGAERLAIVPANNEQSSSNTQSPMPGTATAPASTADGTGLAQASITPQPVQQPVQQYQAPPPVVTPVPIPTPAPTPTPVPVSVTAKPAKPAAKRQPAKKRQSKAAAAAAAAVAATAAAAVPATPAVTPTPVPVPSYATNTTKATGPPRPGLRGSDAVETVASWQDAYQSSWKPQQSKQPQQPQQPHQQRQLPQPQQQRQQQPQPPLPLPLPQQQQQTPQPLPLPQQQPQQQQRQQQQRQHTLHSPVHHQAQPYQPHQQPQQQRQYQYSQSQPPPQPQKQQQTQPYQQHQQPHQNQYPHQPQQPQQLHTQHQPHVQHQPQHPTQQSRAAYGSQWMTAEMYDMLRRQQGQ